MIGSDPAYDTLLSLADPEGAGIPDANGLACSIAALAIRHRVTPVVARRLGFDLDLSDYADLREEAELLAALALQLEALVPEIENGIAKNGLAAKIVKGPDFAQSLYPVLSDRSFTDLDILVDPVDAAALSPILGALGLVPDDRRSEKRARHLSECKWVAPARPGLLVEVHTDLVHYPGLRRHVSFGHADAIDEGQITPTSRFLTAVVHGALGHKFHELRLVIDALQAFRRLPPAARDCLPDAARAKRLSFEVCLTLDILDRLFGAQGAGVLRDRIGGPWAHRAGRLMTRDTLLGPLGRPRSKIRRHGVRALQRMAVR